MVDVAERDVFIHRCSSSADQLRSRWGTYRTLAVFVPGALLMSPVHNVLPALIVWVVVDAIVYCAVAYFIIWLVLRIMQVRPHP